MQASALFFLLWQAACAIASLLQHTVSILATYTGAVIVGPGTTPL